jgi:hypothetical protein
MAGEKAKRFPLPSILGSRLVARCALAMQKAGKPGRQPRRLRRRLRRLRWHEVIWRRPLRAWLAPERAARAKDKLAIRDTAGAAEVVMVRSTGTVVSLEICLKPRHLAGGRRLQVRVGGVVAAWCWLLSGRRTGCQCQSGNKCKGCLTQYGIHVVSPVAFPCQTCYLNDYRPGRGRDMAFAVHYVGGDW